MPGHLQCQTTVSQESTIAPFRETPINGPRIFQNYLIIYTFLNIRWELAPSHLLRPEVYPDGIAHSSRGKIGPVQTLQQVVANPDCVENWIELLSFSFACFGQPFGRGGKRDLSSLASKVSATIACFPAISQPLPPLKPIKIRSSGDNLTARVSSKLKDGDVRGAIQLAASDDS